MSTIKFNDNIVKGEENVKTKPLNACGCDKPRSAGKNKNTEKLNMYRCSCCGVIQEGGDTPPKSCVKCDNEKFYRIK